jgi:hypothetical protein
MYMKMSLNVSSREVQRGERAGARGVGHAVRPVQVEAVRDPPGGDVPEQTGEGVLLPGDVRIGDPLDHVLGLRLGHAGRLQRPPPDRVAEPRAERDDQLQGARDAQDHAHPVAVQGLGRPGPVAGVFQRPTGDVQP